MKAPQALFFFLSAGLFLHAQGDFEKGLSFYKQGQYQKAIGEFEQIVEANPEYEDGFRILGHSYLKTKNYPKAIEAFRSALELKDDNLVSYLGLGQAFFNSKQFGDSIAILLRAERHARTARDRLQIYRIRGAAYFGKKDYQKALVDLEKAQSIRRGNVRDLIQIGVSQFQLGLTKESTRTLRQVLSLDPGNREAQRFLTQLDYREALKAISEKRYAKAAPLLEVFLKQNPKDGEAWFNLGLARLFTDKLGQAEDAFNQSALYLKDNWEVFDRLGYIYEVNKDYTKSLEAYEKAFRIAQKTKLKESVTRIKERIRRQTAKTGQ